MNDKYFQSCAYDAIRKLKERMKDPQKRSEEIVQLQMLELEASQNAYQTEAAQAISRNRLDPVIYQ